MTTRMAIQAHEQDETNLARQAIRDMEAKWSFLSRHLSRNFFSPSLCPLALQDNFTMTVITRMAVFF